MDLARGLGGLGAPFDRPGAALVLAGGEEGDQAQQGVAGLDEPVQAGLGDAQIVQEHLLLLAIQLGDLRLQLGTDGDDLGPLLGGQLLHHLVVGVGVAVGKALLIQVGGVDDGLEGEQLGSGDDGGVVLVTVEGAGGVAVVEPVLQGGEHLHLAEILLVPLGGLLGLVNTALHHLHVGHDQLNVDNADVPGGVHGHVGAGVSYHMHDVLIVEAAHHMHNGVALPDVGQKLVAQALALGGALDQAGNVHKFHHGGGGLLGVVHLGQRVQPVVGYGHHAHVGVDGAEGVVGALSAGVGNGVEQGALAHVGKAHNA